MMIEAILIPLFVQVGLTFMLLFGMGVMRTRDVRSGSVDLRNVGLREPRWPASTTQYAYAFSNQFEVPVLFYVLVCRLIMTRHADLMFVILAWIFVITRIIQAGHPCHRQCGVVARPGVFGRCRRAARDVAHLRDPHSLRNLINPMTPAARLSAAIEALADIEARRRPAADALKDWGLSHRFAGSGDRAAIAASSTTRCAARPRLPT